MTINEVHVERVATGVVGEVLRASSSSSWRLRNRC